MSSQNFTRRGLFQTGGLLAAAGFVPAPGAPATGGLTIGSSIYESIGVTPIVNCKGTFTIISGSQSLPEVKRAMEEASRHYVNLDELMNGVSQRLAELTKADWGIVTAGCAAALTHVTSACIAGGDPEKMQRLPKLAGMKSEVIMPKQSRNQYDHAVRMLGIDVIEVETIEQVESSINPKTALIMIMSSPHTESGPMGTESICKVARAKNVPVIVDAAAEELTIPNKHLARGANMVAYSGGKCLRGPQAAGLLLGQKDLLQAAWINSAPHHAFGRSLKVGKEEIMGMLAAVEMWVKRDHDAEWKQWEAWNNYIGGEATKVPGVTTEILQPEDLSNHAPRLRIKWDESALGITGKQVEDLLFKGRPRIIVGGSSANSITIMPYMMMPDDHRIAASAIHAILAHPPKLTEPARPAGEPASLAGNWDVHIEYVLGSAHHRLTIEQTGNQLTGTHNGETISGALHGTIYDDQAQFRSAQHIQGTVLTYEFHGVAKGNSMEGTVGLGEYGQARWTATRA